MQGGRDPFFGFGDPFASGAFDGHRDLISSFFGGRDPFDDPFFTRPFGGMLESSFFGPSRGPFMHSQAPSLFGPSGVPFMDAQATGFLDHQSSHPPRSRGPIIEELNSDDEQDENEDQKEKRDNPRKHGRSINEPLVEDPDGDAGERRRKQVQFRNDYHRGSIPQSQPRAQSFSFQSSTVTYGGGNGAYYTSSSTRRTGSDGMTFEESKEANSATREAAHRVSRGIHDKGHSVTRKLKSDGRVDSMQTLHNLEEDQLAGFEEAWKGKARKHLPGWTDGLNTEVIGSGRSAVNGANQGGRALPYVGRSNQLESGAVPEMGHAAGPSRPHHAGRGRSAVGGMSGSSSRVKSRAADTANLNQAGKH
ncbi:unnamed protein product [Coffea canephora]|uniref:Glycine-rich protein n=1 Tax=Coffea canephora TaxID=49390 RepID=A0A068UQJ6_COFCA|nr:unnamed protein product [Coffea canephora]